ncbi:putative trna (adenine-n -)-methyltransferase protein [Phaeoacremonium minimum UCRPA7]|uniref:tRNA (adenine(58)-N(1))-methyltransferase catalytic subunit TRM61 n=1 Tax=Phaeoacremonium minimum (strain UCR-PA7) TaxID=1286976 RepID=R8BUC1_PHAM7|nr:putative trna (adenine-n -)-methyltransferase protein [Phaeoacremonium minimum UCRPA7]EOO02972.1 putative trna (adenine-n -)-methyltransferase protein [Phaeoacremonium minimum UCRPA7]
MLDIDLPAPGEDPFVDSAPPFEIFEAGTGHGGLTLHLARAIHGANPPVPPALRTALLHAEYVPKRARFATRDPGEGLPTTSTPERPDHNSLILPSEDTVSAYQAYLPARRAIIQSLDINSDHSRRAHRNIRGFRRGLYALDTSLHVGTISEYIASRFLAQGDEPFLAHAILDLPDPFADQTSVELVTAALRPDGLLLLFCPSITQIAEFIQEATRRGLPFVTSRVVELPTNTMDSEPKEGPSNSGGRDWSIEHTIVSEGPSRKVLTRCRPKVGTLKIVGGGFVGVLQRVKSKDAQADRTADILHKLREKAQTDGMESALQDMNERLSKVGEIETAN